MLCAGCFAPFEHDRHDLVDFRILGVQVSNAAPAPGESIRARALVYGDHGFYHDALPSLSWSLGDASAVGPWVDLAAPDASGWWDLALTVTHADGVTIESAVLPLLVGADQSPIVPPRLPPVERGVVPLPSDSPAEALLLDERLGLPVSPSAWVDVGQAARVRLPLEDPSERYRARWMTHGAQGTFLELTKTTADWVPVTLVLDAEDLEVQTKDALDPGLYSMAVVAMDGQGANAWAFFDLSLEQPTDGDDDHAWMEHDGRLFDLPGPAFAGGLYRVTLVADDASAWGVSLDDPQPILVGDPGVYDQADLAGCEHPIPTRAPLQLDVLAEGLCSRQQLLGARVTMAFTHPIHTWGDAR